MKGYARLAALCLTLIFCLVSASAEKAIVTPKTVTVYKDEGLTAKAGTLYRAQIVDAQAGANGSVRVVLNGHTGYVESGAVTELSELSVPMSVNRNTKAYRSPSTSSKSVSVKKGLTVNRIAVSGNWAMVEYNGVIAYMKTADLSAQTVEPTEAYFAVANSDTPVYRKACDTASYIGTLRTGTGVTVQSVSAGWAYISKDGVYGYAAESALTRKAEPTAAPTAAPVKQETFTAYTAVENMPVYAQPDGNAPVLGKLKSGTQITVYAYTPEWALIGLNGNRGYARVSELSRSVPAENIPTPQPTEEPVIYESFEAEITTDGTAVFANESELSKKLGTLNKGTRVMVQAYTSSWAYVTRGNNGGYVSVQALKRAEQVVEETFTAKVTASSLDVYASASTSAEKLGAVLQGKTVTVTGYTSSWARIAYNGAVGYAAVSGLECYVQPAIDQILDSEDYTVEKKIYYYLTMEMGLNSAAACGVLANVEKECSFHVTSASSDGGYGIVQWTGSRNTRLKNWCKDNGYDHTTLTGQLRYLDYELRVYCKSTLKVLQTTENSAQGAYDAAHYFCYYFEIPSSRATRAVTRGNLAKDKYWPRYNN